MAWTTPVTTFAVHDVLTSTEMNAIGANLNFLRNGVSGNNHVTANVGPTSGATPLVLATLIVTLDGNTKVELSYSWQNINKTVAGDTFQLQIMEGATQIQNFLTPGNGIASTVIGSGVVRAVLTPSAGSHTYTVTLTRTAGTGTATTSSSATAPADFTVSQVT